MGRNCILRIILLLAFAGIGSSASAQNNGGGIVGLWKRLCEPDPKLDSVYIFQPYKGWGVSAGYEMEGHYVSMDTKVDYGIDDISINYHFLLNMDPKMDHKIGLYGYAGPLRLGISQEVGASAGNGKSFSFKLMNNSLSADVAYSRFYSMPKGAIAGYHNDATGEAYEEQIPVRIDRPADLKTFVINASYAFNGRRFSYRAAYDGSVVQRRSAGSFLVAAKYMRGNIELDPDDFMLMVMVSGMGGYVTRQASLGAGYSFNLVPYHRDAAGPRDLNGLRNLTVNATVIPMLTLYNSVITNEYSHKDDGINYCSDIARTYKLQGGLHPNFIGRAAVCYSTGHFSASCRADYTRFLFRNGDKTFHSISGGSLTMSQSGEFSYLTVAFQLMYKF